METLETKIKKAEVLLEREREMRHALEAYRESLVQVQYFNKKGDVKQSCLVFVTCRTFYWQV